MTGPGVHREGPLAGLAVFERGWLSSNNVFIEPAAGEAGAVLVDTGHVNHAAQTVALVQHALQGRPLARVVNTHLHSDHCGGNAALRRAFGAPQHVPPGQADAVRAWDEDRLSYRGTGQLIEPFAIDGELPPGEVLVAGGRHWEVLAAPGHDPHSVMLFDRERGVLISADALWGDGFGVVFPEVQGEPGFDDVGRVLDQIAALPVRWVIPGHGAPFDDVPAALDRARRRLDAFVKAPHRHARYAAKVLIKYHLMEVRRQTWPDLMAWIAGTGLLQGLWERHGPTDLPGPEAWAAQFVEELLAQGALKREGEFVADAG
jgi:glyoxylase-like metal-dependent hydrolase (beta-lactamase superfamily II)